MVNEAKVTMEVEPTLEVEIQEGQLEDAKLKEIQQLIRDNRAGTAAAGLAPPPSTAPASPTMESLPRVPHRIPHPFPHPPPSIRGVKHNLNQAISSPIYHRSFLHLNHRPPPPPRPLYKERAPSSSAASQHCPGLARTERLLCHFFTTIARPPHCRSHPCEARDGLPVHPYHILKFSFQNVNHFSHKKLKISKRIYLF
jgi:hypothetical protein